MRGLLEIRAPFLDLVAPRGARQTAPDAASPNVSKRADDAAGDLVANGENISEHEQTLSSPRIAMTSAGAPPTIEGSPRASCRKLPRRPSRPSSVGMTRPAPLPITPTAFQARSWSPAALRRLSRGSVAVTRHDRGAAGGGGVALSSRGHASNRRPARAVEGDYGLELNRGRITHHAVDGLGARTGGDDFAPWPSSKPTSVAATAVPSKSNAGDRARSGTRARASGVCFTRMRRRPHASIPVAGFRPAGSSGGGDVRRSLA